MPDINLQPLGPQHDRAAFDCGEISVTRYLREVALQAQQGYRSASKVAVFPTVPGKILGYYTLVNHRIVDDQMPDAIAKQLNVRNLRDGAPAILLAQLGVDRSYQSNGLGPFLLKSALLDAIGVAAQVGGVAVLVDALDARRATWYSRNADFRPLREGGTRLLLPMKTLAKALSA